MFIVLNYEQTQSSVAVMNDCLFDLHKLLRSWVCRHFLGHFIELGLIKAIRKRLGLVFMSPILSFMELILTKILDAK